MKHKNTKQFILSILLTIVISSFSQAQFSADLEGGLIFNSFYNEVQIPGDGGSPFDFNEDFSSSPNLYYRVRLNYTIADRHIISALFAPLQKSYEDGIFNEPLFFNEETFQPGTPIQGSYKFNSYRLTYRYLLVNSMFFKFGLGLTGKIRDAAISLTQNNLFSEKTDLGFVPLINFYLAYDFHDRFALLLEGDALAAPQGRAEDVFLGLTYKIINPVSIKAGIRVLEGGANNDEVQNFSWFTYAATGLLITL